VLIVDDEESLVRLVTETLTELGYSTAGFTSSAAALDAFLADPLRFDAVITDESMPGISGSELVRRVRMVRPTIPILLLSGYLSAAVLRRATDAGASEVLKKPLAARQLAAALDRVLHGSPAPGASDINVAAARTPTATPQQRDVLPATSRLRSRRG
jgi:CheY-like chemotaxis protein